MSEMQIGDMIEVDDREDFLTAVERELLAILPDGMDYKYVARSNSKPDALIPWKYARAIVKAPIIQRRWKMLQDEPDNHTRESDHYYNQGTIDNRWEGWYKGAYIDVEIKS